MEGSGVEITSSVSISLEERKRMERKQAIFTLMREVQLRNKMILGKKCSFISKNEAWRLLIRFEVMDFQCGH